MTGALRFEARVRVLPTGGTRRVNGDALIVRDADAVTLLIAAATSYRTYEDVTADPAARVAAALEPASRKSVDTLRAAHVRDYQAAVQSRHARSRILEARADRRARAWVRRRRRSRPCGALFPVRPLPADCQLADRLAAGEPAGPLEREHGAAVGQQVHHQHQHRDELLAGALDQPGRDDGSADGAGVGSVSTGARTAREMYGAGGWVAHHNTDLWRATGPIDGPQYGLWPTGGAWLTLPLWDRYEYTGDRGYLERIYPLLKGAAQFFLDTLVEEPSHHWLVTSPSLSPENPHPFGTSLSAGPAMDEEILRELFGNAIKAAGVLGVDAELRQKWSATRARLAPPQIGSAGQLQEWLDDWDMQAPEIHHRHVSHLFGLFPGHDIDVRRTPELAAAVKRSLEIRGDQATGWATAWRINLWARLADGNHALRHPEVPARSGADVSEHVRRAPAVSDRRQLRRHLRHRRDAAAGRRG